MRLRTIAVSAALGLVLAVGWVPGAHAQGAAAPSGPVERTVVTSDGAMFRGEVMEYVLGEYITLKLDTGELKRIPFSDAAQISPPKPKAPRAATGVTTVSPPTPTPTYTGTGASGATGSNVSTATTAFDAGSGSGVRRTVVTKDGITYHGEVIEYEVGSHVVLGLATGERKRIAWAEAKKVSPPRSRLDTSTDVNSPERTIVFRDGTSLKGELVEAIVMDHTTIKLANGSIRRVLWSDIKRIMSPRPAGMASIPTSGELMVMLNSGGRVQGEYFEYSPDEHFVVRASAGGFRVIPVNNIKQIVVLGPQ